MFDSMAQWVVASGVTLAILGTGFAAAAQEGGAKVAAPEGGAEVGAQEGGAEVGAQKGGAPKKDAARVAAPEGVGVAATKGTEAAASKQGEASGEGPPRARADELVDCTMPGPGRVRVHLDARKEPFAFRGADWQDFIDGRWKHAGWRGTMCRGSDGAEVFICRGACDLFVLPGVYDVSAQSYVGQAVIPAEGARVSRWGSPTVMAAGTLVMGVGYAVGIPLVLVAASEKPTPEWLKSDAGLIVVLALGALAVGGSITALIAGPFVSVKPLAKTAASAPSAITVGAAPLPGGGIAVGGFRF